MGQIIQLDMQTANSIAAGEVVERPASVVKELVENALDARASIIKVAIEKGGIKSIQVVDNGIGMDQTDAVMAFKRHSTSKLKTIEDLDQLMTMGFRGEALASIAAVAKVTLHTRTSGSPSGFFVEIKAGAIESQGERGVAEGTQIKVEDLFFNVPARFKFLKQDRTEAGHISLLIERMAIARPDVSFHLSHNGQELLHTPGNNDLISTLYAVYGREVAQNSVLVSDEEGPVQLDGLIGRPQVSRSNRNQQCFFVNGRLVRSRVLTAALDEAFKGRLMNNRYAVAFLFITVPPNLVDINVHPQKLEVRFWQDQTVFQAVYRAVLSALEETAGVAETILPDPHKQPVKEDSSVVLREPLPLKQELEPMAKPPRSDNIQQPEKILNQQSWLAASALADARLIGTFLKTYIVLEHNSDLLLIDQHAAHEKIIFERLVSAKQKRDTAQPFVQSLLVPQVVELTRAEMGVLKAHMDVLEDVGLSLSLIGPTSVAIRSLPASGAQSLDPQRVLQAALDALTKGGHKTDTTPDEIYYSMACKAAVKANDELSRPEIEQLLADLNKSRDPYHCPHGRPVIVRLSKRELEKMFKRIV